jgi:hypothetical protein
MIFYDVGAGKGGHTLLTERDIVKNRLDKTVINPELDFIQSSSVTKRVG